MRSTQQFSITLPKQMADVVNAKVAAGEYATESEVIRDGLRVLLARDRALEYWLVSVDAYQELLDELDDLRVDAAARERLHAFDKSNVISLGDIQARYAAKE